MGERHVENTSTHKYLSMSTLKTKTAIGKLFHQLIKELPMHPKGFAISCIFVKSRTICHVFNSLQMLSLGSSLAIWDFTTSHYFCLVPSTNTLGLGNLGK